MRLIGIENSKVGRKNENLHIPQPKKKHQCVEHHRPKHLRENKM
jgi:hypothetical protein